MTMLTTDDKRGWFRMQKWLLLRRVSQLSVLAVFLLGPLTGIWIIKGSIASSLTLDTLPLTDPYVLLQSLLTGHPTEVTAIIGALIVTGFYLLAGGRVYCSWVCPINIVTDSAEWFRQRLKIKGHGMRLGRYNRYWILGMTLVLAFVTGTILWELVNPVTMVFRGLVFGVGFSWVMLLSIFLFDLFVSRRGWCGHLCPVGAFYSVLGSISLIRIAAVNRDQCNDCMDCYRVCPEPHVIKPALKGAEKKIGPVILSPNCTNCGRCIDVCRQNVFRFSTRFHHSIDMKKNFAQLEVTL